MEPSDQITLKITLEGLIDYYSLRVVLEQIAKICAKRSDYVLNVWSDEFLAHAWLNANEEIKALANNPAIDEVS